MLHSVAWLIASLVTVCLIKHCSIGILPWQDTDVKFCEIRIFTEGELKILLKHLCAEINLCD